MNKAVQAQPMATDNNYIGFPGMVGFTVGMISMAFACVEAGKYAMTAFLGA